MEQIDDFRRTIQTIEDRFEQGDNLPPNLVDCLECEDPVPKKFLEVTDGYCIECYEEIKFGNISTENNTNLGGSHTYVTDNGSFYSHNK